MSSASFCDRKSTDKNPCISTYTCKQHFADEMKKNSI